MRTDRVLATLAGLVLLIVPLVATPQAGLTVLVAVVAAVALLAVARHRQLQPTVTPPGTHPRYRDQIVPPWLVREPARVPARPRAPGRV